MAMNHESGPSSYGNRHPGKRALVMSMLGERFPQAQFLITGVMGPGSNAHGPNEFLDLPTGVKVTACVAQILADHHRSSAMR